MESKKVKAKREKRHKVRNIQNKIKLIILIAIISVSASLGTNAAVKGIKAPVKAPVAVQKTITPKAVTLKAPAINYEQVSSLAIVANPTKYLNKHVKIRAKFDKFSTLGLDYKPAFRSSDKYITFLIKRDDVTSHTVPLSELKNFLVREMAEKYIDLKAGDEIEYSGTVFSAALGDAWISVDNFTVLNPKPSDKEEIKK